MMPSEGMGTLFFEQGSQTKPPQERQLCLSRAACASVFEVLAHVKRDAQQALQGGTIDEKLIRARLEENKRTIS